jgi:hypothetical protein
LPLLADAALQAQQAAPRHLPRGNFVHDRELSP